jgi:hypothetical protein
MGKYICKVLPTEECNEDFAPDRDMIEGVEVDGFMLICWRDRKPYVESMMGISVADLKKWICQKGPGAQKVRAAGAIAEGEIRAMEILDEQNGDKSVTLTGKTLPISMEQIRKVLGKD